MTEQRSLTPQSAAELVIVFDYRRELLAADLGSLLTALAKDYARAYRGRTLVVSSIEKGSLLVAIHDAVSAASPFIKDGVEIARGIKSITDFAASIRKLVLRKKDEAAGVKAPAPKTRVDRSVQEIVRIAAVSGSEVTIRQTEADGRITEISLASREAIEIRERETTRRSEAPPAGRRVTQPTFPDPLPVSFQPIALADQFEKLDQAGSHGREAVISAIASVAAVVRDAGHGRLLEPLALELESRGLHDWAAAVRAEDGGTADQTFTTA